jgi:hypothetical protein
MADDFYTRPGAAPGFTPQSVEFADGPLGASKKVWNNATRGHGMMGLISPDGTVEGAVSEGANVVTPGASKYVGDLSKALSPAPAAPQPDAPITADPGGGGDSTEKQDENERIMKLARLEMKLGGGVKQQYFQQEGASKAPIGGPELYDEAFVNAPRRRQTEMEGLGQLQNQRATELARMYDRQVAQDQAAAVAMQARREAEQAEIARKQEELAKATRYYTRELQDSGKYWANPGNIIAAISYSLLPVFSNDPSIGVKLINQAVQQDFDNRMRLADMAVGNARSNLEGYRKIAGDRQQGDLLARAEAHRVAAMDIERIGAKFSGPEAQKNIAIAIEDQKTRAAAAEMEFYAKYIHTAPKRTLPGETAAMYKGPGGWAPLGQTGGVASGGTSAHRPEPGKSPVMGEIAGGPSLAPQAPLKNPTLAAVTKTKGPEAAANLIDHPAVAGKVSDEDIENLAIMLARREALATNKHPLAVLREERAKLEPRIMEMQKSASTRSLIASVRSKMDIIERTELGEGRDPEQFLSWARTAWPTSWVLEYEKFTAKDPRFAANAAEMRSRFREQKMKELRADLAGVFNQHNHELFGGAQTEKGSGGGEIGRGAMEIGNKSSFHQTKVFLDNRARELQKPQTELKVGLSPLALIILRMSTEEGASDSYLPHKNIPGPKGSK